MASHGEAWCMGCRGRTEGAGSLDEWNHRKPVRFPRDRLLGKPDPAPADDFLFRGSRKVNLLLTVYWPSVKPSRWLNTCKPVQSVLFLREGGGSGAKPKIHNVVRPRHHHIYSSLYHMEDEPLHHSNHGRHGP